jgi:hypothetical protein
MTDLVTVSDTVFSSTSGSPDYKTVGLIAGVSTGFSNSAKLYTLQIYLDAVYAPEEATCIWCALEKA